MSETPAALDYRVDLSDARRHRYRVSLRVAAPQADQTVSLPVWIPGSYLVREFARHLDGLAARQDGAACAVEALDKASWRVRCAAGRPLDLSWTVYAFDTSVRAAWLDAARGFFNGTSLFLRVHGAEALPHRLELAGLPEGWQVATAMAGAGLRFEAADYDEFVDHPFELGTFWRGEFDAGGVPHRVVVAGAPPSFDGARLLADVRRLCEAEISFWGGAPFAAYTFLLNTVADGHGGLEHRASTALLAARGDLPRHDQAEASDAYVNLLSLFAHEYFHAWSVKRLRPAEFARYDYGGENYTRLLWFFEGFTSYYDERFVQRCGLIDAQRWLKLVGDNLGRVLATPGRHRQSVAQASFDAWVRLYRPDENSPNSSVSYYAKGALVGLALDLRLREAGASLDALMTGLWRASGGGPVDEAMILTAVREIGGAGGAAVATALADWVHGTADLPLAELFARFGVLYEALAPTLAQRLGLRVAESALTGVQVKQVLDDSAAQGAGLAAGDELLACHGWRLRRLDDALVSLAPGATRLRLLVGRDQRVLELDVELPPAEAGGGGVRLRLAENVDAAVLARRQAWLGV
ncbi:MAG: M61 family metallopeptidase [Pelomonas sp.]|nr:M61 family metallopeptidase [Roseateles sp.]